jgi:hypothetical protein
MEVCARKLSDDLVPPLRIETLIADTQHIQADAVVEQLRLNRLVGGDARRGVQRDRVPGSLDAGVRNPVMLQELTHRIGAVHLEAVVRATEGLQRAQIVERRADKQQLRVVRLACLPAKFVGPEQDASG